MSEKLKALSEKITNDRFFDVSKFNDDVALKTEWIPLKGGGKNFGSHQLKKIDNNRVEFKSSAAGKIFSLVFLIAGAYLAYSGFSKLEVPLDQIFESNGWLPILAGLVFFFMGTSFFSRLSIPIIFDKSKGMFWKGRKAPERNLKGNNAKNLSDIHALQILRESVRSSSNQKSYKSFELNLVFKDGSRMNVVDHGNAGKLREDAKSLSKFLGVPVWEAVNA